MSMMKFPLILMALLIFVLTSTNLLSEGAGSFQNLYLTLSFALMIVGLMVKRVFKLAIKVMIFGTLIFISLSAISNL